jgi:serine/threonine protein kinase
MEYLPGGTLKDRIARAGRLSPREAVEVAIQVAEALQAAHERGVVHRDVKPGNVLVTRSGHTKVTDFGIARAAEATTISKPGDILGSAKYMSPEQAAGGRVGPQATCTRWAWSSTRCSRERALRRRHPGGRARRAREGSAAPPERGEPGGS